MVIIKWRSFKHTAEENDKKKKTMQDINNHK